MHVAQVITPRLIFKRKCCFAQQTSPILEDLSDYYYKTFTLNNTARKTSMLAIKFNAYYNGLMTNFIRLI